MYVLLTVMTASLACSLGITIYLLIRKRVYDKYHRDRCKCVEKYLENSTQDLEESLHVYMDECRRIKHIHEIEDSLKKSKHRD